MTKFLLFDISLTLYYSLRFQTGHTALQRAAAEGHLEVVKHLVGRGASIDHQDEVVSEKAKFRITGSVHFPGSIGRFYYFFL